MAVSRPAIEAAGLLDEDLFAYVEDVDWSLRIREAGFACAFVPEARGFASLRKRPPLSLRSLIALARGRIVA